LLLKEQGGAGVHTRHRKELRPPDGLGIGEPPALYEQDVHSKLVGL